MSRAIKKAIDDAREAIAGRRDRHALALILGILKRLADQPQIEQPIAPEPPVPPEEVTPPPEGTAPPV